jgi:hypothetical protein
MEEESRSETLERLVEEVLGYPADEQDERPDDPEDDR